MAISVTMEMATRTCENGHVYAVPNWVPSHRCICPMCAEGEIRDVNQRFNAEIEEEIKKDRTIAGLRGALSVAKRKGK